VAMLAEASRPVMGATTGFHANQHWGQLCNKGYQGMPVQLLAKYDLSCGIRPHGVKHTLCDVDPEYAHLLLHWTRLL
jgi:hypothetical protein